MRIDIKKEVVYTASFLYHYFLDNVVSLIYNSERAF